MLDSNFFLDLNIENIMILENSNPSSPDDYEQCYADMDLVVGKLKFDGWSIKSQGQQVLKFKTKSGAQLSLKRKSYRYSANLKDLMNDANMKSNINIGYKEYTLTKFISAHPAGIKAFDFKITKLSQQNCLVTEFLMEDAGVFLSKQLNNIMQDEGKIVKLLRQSASVLRFIEMLKIIYNDIKADNFLIDNKGNLRIVDYDVSQTIAMNYKIILKKSTVILGISKGFCSPEALRIFTKQIGSDDFTESSINPSRSDVYSWGILGLLLMNGLDEGSLPSLDKWKKDEKLHKNLTDMIDNIKLKDKTLLQKMKAILGSCLNFFPEKRIRFKEISRIMKNLDLMSLNEIQEIVDIADKGISTSIDKETEKVRKMHSLIKAKDNEILNLTNQVNELFQTLEEFKKKNVNMEKQIKEREEFIKLKAENAKMHQMLQQVSDVGIGNNEVLLSRAT